MIFSKLLPRDGNFFHLFNQHALHMVQAAKAFASLVENYHDVALRERWSKEVDDAEHAADRITREVSRLLHTTFITPIDREQIHVLINTMDDVADLLQDTAQTMTLYDVRATTPEIVRLTELNVKCCLCVQEAIGMLEQVSQADVAQAAVKTCEEIDRLESDADRVMRDAISRLFREQDDVRELIKLKAIYELLESITDRCEDIANQIEGVVLENS